MEEHCSPAHYFRNLKKVDRMKSEMQILRFYLGAEFLTSILSEFEETIHKIVDDYSRV